MRNHRKSILYCSISGIFILLEQSLAFCAYQNIDVPAALFQTVYYLAYALAALTLFVLLSTAYRLYQGYYLSCGILFAAVGVICSCLWGNYLLVNCTGTPVLPLLTGFLPFAAGGALGILCDYCIRGIREKKLWIRR